MGKARLISIVENPPRFGRRHAAGFAARESA
jgi:hypothetical protein